MFLIILSLFPVSTFASVSDSCENFTARADWNYTYAYISFNTSFSLSEQGSQYCANNVHPKSFLPLVQTSQDASYICDQIIGKTGLPRNAWSGLLQRNTSVEPGGNWYWTVDNVPATLRTPFWIGGYPNNGATFAQCSQLDCTSGDVQGLIDNDCASRVTFVCQIKGMLSISTL
jgi:hypothetical protein